MSSWVEKFDVIRGNLAKVFHTCSVTTDDIPDKIYIHLQETGKHNSENDLSKRNLNWRYHTS